MSGLVIDRDLASLDAEGALQKANAADPHVARTTKETVQPGPDNYYGRPMLKQPVWTIDIPLYYFFGGAAGASLTLGAALQLAPRSARAELRQLSAACHWIGIIGSTAGAGLLIHDLGRPARFLHMMRVFRPTSPMNLGTWILAGAAPTAIVTGLLINSEGVAGVVGEISGFLSGVFGAALAGYTGVLVSNTAIPVWRESRHWLPILFAASGASAATGVIQALSSDRRSRVIMRNFGTVARLAEIAAALQTERAVSAVPRIAAPLGKGKASLLWKSATALTSASLVLSLTARRSRMAGVIAGCMGIAGSLCLRFAVHYAGIASARDPQAAAA